MYSNFAGFTLSYRIVIVIVFVLLYCILCIIRAVQKQNKKKRSKAFDQADWAWQRLDSPSDIPYTTVCTDRNREFLGKFRTESIREKYFKNQPKNDKRETRILQFTVYNSRPLSTEAET